MIKSRQRSALVTGSRGFVGSYLCKRLRTEGWDVFDLQGKLHTMHTLPIDGISVDVVFHNAALVGSERFELDPLYGYDTNVTGTMAVLNYCRNVGANCVNVSSGSVYREPDDGQLIDEDCSLQPSTPYGLSKLLAERLCNRMWLDEGVGSTVLRVFNPYGVGQRNSFLVPYIVRSLRERSPIALRTPNAVRDFVYVEDVVEALVLAAEPPLEGFRVMNIASGVGTEVKELVALAEEIFGSGVKLENTSDGPEGSAIVADISRAKTVLGWNPKYDLRSGLEAMKRTLDGMSTDTIPS